MEKTVLTRILIVTAIAALLLSCCALIVSYSLGQPAHEASLSIPSRMSGQEEGTDVENVSYVSRIYEEGMPIKEANVDGPGTAVPEIDE